jgi:hypothetical protein
MRTARSKRRAFPTTAAGLTVLALNVVGCGSTHRQSPSPAESGGAAAETPVASGGGTGGADGGEGNGVEACDGNAVAVSKRLVRLSFNQVGSAVLSLTNDEDGRRLLAPYELVDGQHRTFPPLASPREGATYSQQSIQIIDALAKDVAQYAVDHFATFTGCGALATEACVRDFVASFAERAYRRPLTRDEKASLLQVVSEVTLEVGSPTEALRYGVQAALSAPQFLYRTEFGEDATEAGPLTPHELADELSFFLTDAPPDPELRDAARDGLLSNAAQISAHTVRLLATPRARKNLEDAMFSYLGLAQLQTVVIEDLGFTNALRASMYRESERFLARTLWSAPLTALLTSRQSSIDASLASIYGLPAFPPLGVAADSDGFALVELPENRAGILTQAGLLTSRARPDGPSVVARALLVSASIACQQNPPFPEGVADAAIGQNDTLRNGSEREKAELRATNAPCADCHTLFDAYGLALDTFDNLGRFRTTDDRGRVIDPVVTLPAFVGGSRVSSAAEMAAAIANSGRFESCMAQRLLSWALADLPPTQDAARSLAINGCATRVITDSFRDTGGTFSELLTQIATSETLRQRVAGAAGP